MTKLKRMVFLVLACLTVIALVVFAGCDNGNSGDQNNGQQGESQVLTGDFTLSAESITFTKLGESVALTAKVGDTDVYDVTYTSAKEETVKVVGNALIAMGDGKTTVTAKRGDKEAVCVVTVATAAGVEIEGDAVRNISTTDDSAKSITLSANITGYTVFDDEDAGVTWSSSDDSIATVNATTGVVTAVGTGIAVITAKSNYSISLSSVFSMMGRVIETVEEYIPEASITVFVNNEFDKTANADILGSYSGHYDWQGFAAQASEQDPCYTQDNFLWIRAKISVELNADGTFVQQILNAQRKTYPATIDSSLPESTYAEQVAKYGSNNCYIYNRAAQDPTAAEFANETGKTFATIEGMTSMGANNFAEKGYFAIFDGKLVLYFNGVTHEWGEVAGNAYLSNAFVHFDNMVAMSANMNQVLTKN